jgi:hypothetical protein
MERRVQKAMQEKGSTRDLLLEPAGGCNKWRSPCHEFGTSPFVQEYALLWSHIDCPLHVLPVGVHPPMEGLHRTSFCTQNSHTNQ